MALSGTSSVPSIQSITSITTSMFDCFFFIIIFHLKGVVRSKISHGYVEVNSLGETSYPNEIGQKMIENQRVKYANFSYIPAKFAASTQILSLSPVT